MCLITRSGPFPLSLSLWRLIIVAITHWNGEGRGCNRLRDVFPVLTPSLPPVGDGAGGRPGGSPGGAGGSPGERRTSGSSKKVRFGGDGLLVSSLPPL